MADVEIMKMKLKRTCVAPVQSPASTLLVLLLIILSSDAVFALDYPAVSPGNAKRSVVEDRAILENAVVRAEWKVEAGRLASMTVKNKHSGQKLKIDSGHLPVVVLGDGSKIVLEALQPVKPVGLDHNAIAAVFEHKGSGLRMRWSAALDDGDNAIIQSLETTASRDAKIEEIVFLDAVVEGARQVGEVSGSVVTCRDIFMAVEHPLAHNRVGEASDVRCALPRGNVLSAGQTWTYSSVFGVVPEGQLRRGFLYYLERRRAHPYRQFLHYNNWYDVFLGRRIERIRESECLDAINYFGTELVKKRDVKMEGFVWDDGWDNFATLGEESNSLWGFHQGFPDGFKNLISAAAKFDAAQGVWMSPWGGYATAKDKRIAYGKTRGYEVNSGGFSMAGPKYQEAFRDVCLDMMRNNGVNFFKFDGMGGGVQSEGSGNADDIDAVLELTTILRKENPDVFISATIGTWASPFWLLYADSIWRQGADNALHGKGDTRQQWLTYRDKLCYERIVQLGPLYPLSSLMLHGVLIGKRKGRSPSRLAFVDKSVGDEAWSFFGSGTCLQELYVAPHVMTDTMTDHVADAANWARRNSDVLIDSHWIGGHPGKEQVYGWASWKPGKGIVVLRNPSDKQQVFSMSPKQALELPKGVNGKVTMTPVYPKTRKLEPDPLDVIAPVRITLEPFETVVMEFSGV